MTIKVKAYQVIQNPSWACPGMLIFCDQDDMIIGQRQNPDNSMTENWADPEVDGKENWGKFNPKEYKSVELISENFFNA